VWPGDNAKKSLSDKYIHLYDELAGQRQRGHDNMGNSAFPSLTKATETSYKEQHFADILRAK
jgi:hypothetical protein